MIQWFQHLQIIISAFKHPCPFKTAAQSSSTFLKKITTSDSLVP